MKWLHISDVHFKNFGYDTSKLRKSLVDRLTDLQLKLDFIIITGDCFYRNEATAEIITELKKFLSDIGKSCKVVNNKIYLCLGNHDINRSDNNRNRIIDDIREKGIITPDIFNQLEEIGSERFKLLYTRLKGSTKTYRSYQVIEPKDIPVRIVVVNSCLLSKDDNDYQQLRVCVPKLAELSRRIKNDDKLNIVMMHHGIEWLHPDDARKFEHWVEDNSIDVVYCGHTHRAAIYTLNDVNRDILQFTSGALLIDNYAYPSFYLCEHENSDINTILYTFSKDTEKWTIDTHHLRKFTGGIYRHELSRKKTMKHNMDDDDNITDNENICSQLNKKCDSSLSADTNTHLDISKMACDEVISTLNQKYYRKFDSMKIYSNKTGEKEDFNAWKIVNSLVCVGMPYPTALKLTCEVIDIITSSDFEADNILESGRIKKIIYDAILNSKSYLSGLSEYDIGVWASTYARHYDKEQGFMLIDNSRQEQISFSLLKNEVLKEVISNITGNVLYYEIIYTKEKSKMASKIMRFIKNLGIFEIKKKVLAELVEEYITVKPHQWFVSGNNDDFTEYHLSSADKYINVLKTRVDIHPVLQIEAVYHLSVAILSKYHPFVGCTAISAITILYRSLKYKDIIDDRNLPVLRYQLVQLEKDLLQFDYSFEEFKKQIACIYKKIVEEKNVTSEEAIDAIITLREMANEITMPRTEMYLISEHTSVFKSVYEVFNNAIGFLVKKPLRHFDNKAFFVSPHWEIELKETYNLSNDILVCMLEGKQETDDDISEREYHKSRTIDSLISYFKIEKKYAIKDIVLFKDNMKGFAAEERKLVREKLKEHKIHKRCAFIQMDDFRNIELKGWRAELIRIIISSRFSG